MMMLLKIGSELGWKDSTRKKKPPRPRENARLRWWQLVVSAQWLSAVSARREMAGNNSCVGPSFDGITINGKSWARCQDGGDGEGGGDNPTWYSSRTCLWVLYFVYTLMLVVNNDCCATKQMNSTIDCHVQLVGNLKLLLSFNDPARSAGHRDPRSGCCMWSSPEFSGRYHIFLANTCRRWYMSVLFFPPRGGKPV